MRKVFKSRSSYENHLITVHKLTSNKIRMNDVKDSSDNQNETLVNILSSMEKILNKTVEDKKPTQLINAKMPPSWIGQDYEVFEKEMKEWSEMSGDDDYEKYVKTVENLKKNNDIKGLKEYVIEVLMPIANSKKNDELTVDFVLENLRTRFGKSKVEKLKELIEKIVSFQVDSNETCTEYVDRFNRLITTMEKEEGERYFKFMACLFMIDRAYTGGLVMSEEKSRLLNAIQKGENPKERTPVFENEVIEKLNNEFYKMKIENNVSKNKVSGTYFENGRSRYDNWRSFKNSSDQIRSM